MIDTEALRKKVIDLAIQGKLTEQLPSDGDAESLYAQIQEEKEKRIKAGELKKEKTMPSISESDTPFDIPGNWHWVYMGEIFDHNTGKALNNADKDGVKLEYITTSNMYWDHFELDGLKSMYFKESEIEKCTITKGDLLICEGGDIGRSAIWTFDYDMRIQNHIHKLRGYGGIEHKFYFYIMWNYKDSSMIDGRGIGLQGFSSKRVHSLIVPLPPLAEQKRIVEKLDTLLEQIDIIDTLQQQYESNLSVLKGKIIDAGIQGKLTEQLPDDGDAEDLYAQILNQKSQLIKEGKIKKEKTLPDIASDEIPFEIPKNWKWVRWGMVVNVVSARRVHQSDWRKEGIPFYRAREIAKLADTGAVDNDLFISEELYDEFSKSGVPKCGDLMVTGVGTLGKTYVVKEDEKFYYKDASVLCFENYAGLVAPFLKHLMDSDTMHTQINSNSGGTTVDTLTMVRMNQYLMPLPPLDEQKRIVSRIDEILEQLNL